MKNRYLYFAFLLSFIGQAQVYSGTTSLGSSMTLNVTMNTTTDSLEIELSGPSSGYFSVGFGAPEIKSAASAASSGGFGSQNQVGC